MVAGRVFRSAKLPTEIERCPLPRDELGKNGIVCTIMKAKLSYAAIQTALLSLLVITYWETAVYFSERPERTDFARFYVSGRFLLQGEDIYRPVMNRAIDSHEDKGADSSSPDRLMHQNLNSPLHTLFLAPLSALDFHTAFWIWSIFSYACGLLAGPLVVFNSFGRRGWSLAAGSWILLFAYFPTFVGVYLGQFSLVLLLLIAMMWLWSRDGKDFSAGLVLGLTISLKLFAGLFLLLFAFQQRWRLVWAALGCVILLNLIGVAALGFQPYVSYADILLHLPWHDSSWNASLAGFFTRVIGRSELTSLTTAPLGARAVVLFCSLSLLVFIGYWVRKHHAISSLERHDLFFSITLVAMLLLSPYAWIYYFPTLMVPLVVTWRMSARGMAKRAVTYCLAGAWLLGTIPTAFQKSDVAHLKRGITVYVTGGIYFYSLVVLFIILAYCLTSTGGGRRAVDLP